MRLDDSASSDRGKPHTAELPRSPGAGVQPQCDAMPAHFALIDASGTIVAVDSNWHSFAVANLYLGIDRGVGVNYLRICDQTHGEHGDEAQQFREGICRVISGTAPRFDLICCRDSPDGVRRFWVKVTALIPDCPQGAVVRYSWISEGQQSQLTAKLFTDATTTHPAPTQAFGDDLRLESSPNPAAWIGCDGEIMMINQAGAGLLGYSMAELSEMTIFDVRPEFTPDDWQTHWRKLKQRNSQNIQISLRRKDCQFILVAAELYYSDLDGRECELVIAHDLYGF